MENRDGRSNIKATVSVSDIGRQALIEVAGVKSQSWDPHDYRPSVVTLTAISGQESGYLVVGNSTLDGELSEAVSAEWVRLLQRQQSDLKAIAPLTAPVKEIFKRTVPANIFSSSRERF